MCTSKKNENVLKKGGETYLTRTRLIYVILDDRNTKFLNHRVFFHTNVGSDQNENVPKKLF